MIPQAGSGLAVPQPFPRARPWLCEMRLMVIACTLLCTYAEEDAVDMGGDPHKSGKEWSKEEKAEMEKELKRIFKVLDRNKDKKLSLKEIKKHLNKVSPAKTFHHANLFMACTSVSGHHE